MIPVVAIFSVLLLAVSIIIACFIQASYNKQRRYAIGTVLYYLTNSSVLPNHFIITQIVIKILHMKEEV